MRSASSPQLPTRRYYLDHQRLFTDILSLILISNGHRQAVGDGAPLDASNAPSVLAVCNIHGGNANTLYYSTTFSGGPAVRMIFEIFEIFVRSFNLLTNHAPPSGVFDPAMEKCPPDIGGSGEHVRGALPSVLSSKSILSAHSHTPSPKSLSLSSSAPAAASPRPIHYSAIHANKSYPITPPLTPDSIHSASSFTSSKSSSSCSNGAGLLSTNTNGEPSTFLKSLFPEHVTAAHPFASPIRIDSQPDSAWDGFVMSLPGKPQTLYVDGSGAGQHMLRER